MTPNRANIELVFKNLSAAFNNAYGQAAPTWPSIAMLVNSTTSITEHPWLTNFPQMRRWIGERAVKQLAAHVYRLKNLDYEATIAVDKNDIMDDQLGMYAREAAGAGVSAGNWPDEMVFNAANNAFNASYEDPETGEQVANACHDGKAFFAADHPLDDADPFSNLLTAALKADTQANAEASFGKAETMLMEMKDPEGRPLGLQPKTLLVPPALKATANILMMADRLDDKPNPYKGSATVKCSPRLTSKTAWMLLAEGGNGLLPFLWQLRQAPQIDTVMDPTNPHVFNRREYLYGIHGRGAAGYTLPQLAVGSTGTT